MPRSAARCIVGWMPESWGLRERAQPVSSASSSTQLRPVPLEAESEQGSENDVEIGLIGLRL
jgi:hypothetical protein